MNESDFKQRMIGAIVLIALGVIFIPILLNGEADDGMPLFGSNIPERHKSTTDMKPINLGSNISPPENNAIETIVVDKLSPKIVKPAKAIVVSKEKNNLSQAKPTVKPEIKKQAKEKKGLKEKTLKTTAWVIQVGSFSNKKNALALQNKLRKKKFRAFVEAVKKQAVLSYRVRVGPEVRKKNAESIQKRLKKEMRINGIVMKYKG